jgi:hypothetical protein
MGMGMRMRMHTLVATVALLTLACGKKTKTETDPSAEPAGSAASVVDGAITEEHDDGSIAWTIGADGAVRAIVKAGLEGPKTLSGSLTWKAPGAQAISIPMEAKADVLTAAGPKLQAGLTQIEYTANVDGKAWTGVLHVPPGGTLELVESAKVSADVKGPNGGVVQIVGDDRIEIVADKSSGQVRVYVLDADNKVIDVGDRKIQIAIVADAPEVVVLTPEPKRMYFVGTVKTRVAPIKITVSVTVKARTRVVLVGWKPGARVVVGSRAPRVNVWIVGKHEIDHDDPHVKVKIHQHGKGNGKAKIDIKIR